MKYFILLGLLIGFSGYFLLHAAAMCAYNEDWPQAPCLDTPPYTIEEQKQAWSPYYNYKGSAWMEEKKSEMINALDNGNFWQWVDQPDDYSHWNVYEYFSIFEGFDYENYKPTTTFSIIEKQVKYVIPYEITNGTIDDMKLNCDPPSLTISILSSNSGKLKIDFPRKMIGILYSVLVDEKDLDDKISLDGNILTIIFPNNTNTIEVKGSYYLSSNKDGVCDVIHNPPYSYILSPHKQMKMGIPLYEIKCKEGLNPIVKRDRITPACVTDNTWNELLMKGWALLRMGMPAETNVLITYDAITVYPQKVTKELDPRSPFFNMVFWVNNDVVPHTVIAEDGRWSTGQIESGDVGSMSFNQTGIYSYYIKEKPETIGTIEFSGILKLDDE